MGYNEQRLGKVIKRTRIKRKMTREELAEKLNISTRYLAYIEEGERAPSYQLLCSIVYVLSIPSDYIFYSEEIIKCSSIDAFITVLRKCDRQTIDIITKILHRAIDDIYEDQ